MPIHDWTRVDANIFHDFHQAWTIEIRDKLNGELLPKGYSALVEQHAGGPIPDVLALQHRRATDFSAPSGGAVVTDIPPKASHVFRAKDEVLAGRGNRVAIRHPLGEVVCIIEIVSPGNKGSGGALRAFVQKTVDFLRQGVNVLVIDLFPPTVRDPSGINQEIWREFEDRQFDLPADKRLSLASYVADYPKTAYVEFVGVGDELPDMTAWLNLESYVLIPLEATYLSTWRRCPEVVREAVENDG
jgi:hypothetical protein